MRQSIHGRYIDVTDDFMLSKNDTNDFYRPSKLVRKFNSATPSTKLLVIFDYFEHTNLQNDFYSAESFGELTYKDIPKLKHQYLWAMLLITDSTHQYLLLLVFSRWYTIQTS